MNFKILVHIIFTKKQLKSSIYRLLLVFITANTYAQEVVKDSVWLSIAPIEKSNSENVAVDNDYRLLYVKPIQVSQIEAIPARTTIKPLMSTTKDLLQQFHLANSYDETAVKGTKFGESLHDAAYISYPFANVLTANLASRLGIANSNPKIRAYQNQVQVLSTINTEVIRTSKMTDIIFKNHEVKLDKRLYLRKRLLDILVGNNNQKPDSQQWILKNDLVEPYISNYDNQFMIVEGTHKLLKQVLPAFEHFENYDSRINNIKKGLSVFFRFRC